MKQHTNKNIRPESKMMSEGYNPFWSEGAIKPPLFQTSTFEFACAEDGKEFFARAYGLKEADDKPMGLIYSRLNNPNLEILETRLCQWDEAEACAVFSSGMAGITSVIMEFTKPGDFILASLPIYGGTSHFLSHILPKYNITPLFFLPSQSEEEINQLIDDAGARNLLALILTETPTNPTNQLVDLRMCKRIANACKNGEENTLLAVDNTFMGPIWQQPLQFGADLVMYSATKYIGGHSDVVAGAVLGNNELIGRVKGHRTFYGNMPSPQTAWMLTRSLETLKVRMEQQARNAEEVAKFLAKHPMVEKLYYLGDLQDEREQDIFDSHFSSAGAMIAFDIVGGEKEAFQFLNALTLVKLAVSLGGTESLAQHPNTMTHTDMSDELKEISGVSPQLIRISIGLENANDIIDDLSYAFSRIQNMKSV